VQASRRSTSSCVAARPRKPSRARPFVCAFDTPRYPARRASWRSRAHRWAERLRLETSRRVSTGRPSRQDAACRVSTAGQSRYSTGPIETPQIEHPGSAWRARIRTPIHSYERSAYGRDIHLQDGGARGAPPSAPLSGTTQLAHRPFAADREARALHANVVREVVKRIVAEEHGSVLGRHRVDPPATTSS